MTASINGVPFYVNPSSIAWNYQVKLATHKTIGGKVVQLFGFSLGDLIVSGKFGKDAIERQRAFFRVLDSIAAGQSAQRNGVSQPVRFLWPEQNWDFWVFIKGVQQPGASVSIENNVRIHNPGYTLTLFVYEDNGSIVKAATAGAQMAYLKRLSAGLGWKQTEYNGPLTVKNVQERLQGGSIFDYAFTQYGLLPGGTGIDVSVQGAP